MKFDRTLFFYSPIKWEHPNKQLQLFAEKISEEMNVLYISTFELERIYVLDLIFSRSSISNYLFFLRNIFLSKKKLITKTPFITFQKYEFMEEFSVVDEFFFRLQVILYLALSQKNFKIKDPYFWVNTSFFPQALKKMSHVNLLFDFYDRPSNFLKKSDNKLFIDNETWLAQNSRFVIVNSTMYKKIVDSLKISKEKVLSTPVGYSLMRYVDTKRLKMRKPEQKITVGYGGNLSRRLDFDLIRSVVLSSPEIDFVFVGPVEYEDSRYKSWWTPYHKITVMSFIKEMKSYSNITFLKSRDSISDQIQILSTFTIGWIPYDLKVPFNYYCNPTKFYEYCALGIPVISTELPVLKDHSKFIHFIKDKNDFASSVQEILRTQEVSFKSKNFAKKQNIDEKYKMIRGYLKS